MKIQYLGHSTLYIEINDQFILVDPFISGNPNASAISVNSLKVDFVLLTHAHQDHTLDVEAILTRTKALLISNHEIVSRYEQMGFRGHGMNHGGSWDFDFGRLKAVQAIHSSSFPDGSYGGNPMGFVLKTEDKTIYIAGDTALTMDMKLIPMFFTLDLAILPIGGNYTMDVEEAVVAADFVECDKTLGIHYDTFPALEINHDEAKKTFADKGKELILLSIGESVDV